MELESNDAHYMSTKLSPQVNTRTKLLIDCRESLLTKAFFETNPQIEIKQLELGDVQIWVEENMICLIERKTIADLAASIKDGRYREQKARVQSNLGDTTFMYVVEGTFTFDPNITVSHMNNKSIVGSIINSIMRDKIPVVFTRNINETIFLIKGIFSRIDADPEKYIMSKEITLQEHQNTLVNVRKKENVDKTTCLMMQLCNIPGISTKKARDIIAYFKLTCIANFVNILSASDDKIQLLMEVNGIGKKIAETIVNFIT